MLKFAFQLIARNAPTKLIDPWRIDQLSICMYVDRLGYRNHIEFMQFAMITWSRSYSMHLIKKFTFFCFFKHFVLITVEHSISIWLSLAAISATGFFCFDDITRQISLTYLNQVHFNLRHIQMVWVDRWNCYSYN